MLLSALLGAALLSGCGAQVSSVSPATPLGRTFHAFGDSITYGATLSTPSLAYPYLIAQDRSFALTDYAISGDQACDLPARQIFPNLENPAAGTAPLYTLMIGTNDEDGRGANDYLATYNACLQASIVWLALPADLKVLATDPGVVSSGPGTIETSNHWNAWETATLNASVTFPITLSVASPIYIWRRILDSDPGTAAFAVDGVPAGTFTTMQVPYIQTQNGTTGSLAFLRLNAIPAGRHTVTFTQTSASGTMRIVAIGAPPAASRTLPTVILGDPPLQLPSGPCAIAPATCTPYLPLIHADVALFASDGLDVRYAENHTFMLGTPAEMDDALHPDPLGQSELRTAFEALLP